ncbi:MAG TPA: Ig-like domain-containing protein [Casimicrobiaceae bacterium]|nr:Ig-like domain-containing protein [Casimicrobiaceae bacterium]
MIVPTLETVHDALASGLDGLVINDGTRLHVSSELLALDAISIDQLPFLLLRTGSFTASEWQPFVQDVLWDITAELKVSAAPGKAPRELRRVVERLFDQMGRLRGLFVDESGNIVPFSDHALDLYRRGKLTSLAFRAGPFLKSMRARPEAPDAPFAVADLVFHVEYLANHDPSEPVYARTASTGFNVLGVEGGGQIDTNSPMAMKIPTPALQDRRTWTQFADATEVAPANLPFVRRPIRDVAGPSYAALIKEINVSPRLATLSGAGATLQLSAIAIRVSGASEYVTQLGSWSSSDPTKATVSATGLVTRVAAGQVAITCSYGGAVGTAQITLT